MIPPKDDSSDGDSSQRSGIRNALIAFDIPNFRLLWAGRVTSNMARAMRNFLRVWIVWQYTGSPLRLGIVSASLAWPMLFVPFVGGFLADRLDQRRLLQFTEVGLVILWGAVAALVFVDHIQWWHFVISGLVSGVIQSVGRPVHQAIIGTIVDRHHLPSAVALDTAADTWPRAAGPAIGGILIGIIGIRWTFLLHVFGQAFTAVTIYLLQWNPAVQKSKQANRTKSNSFFAGFQYIWQEPILFGLVGLGVCFAMIGGSVHFLLPIFADSILGVGGSGLGFLMTASTLGASCGSIIVLFLSNFPRRGYLLLTVAILNTILLFLFSRSDIFVFSMFIVVGMGIASVMFRTFRVVAMQILAPDEIRGRIMSFQTSIQGMSWVGVLIMGAIAELLTRKQTVNLGFMVLGGDASAAASDTVFISSIMYGIASLAFFVFVPALRQFK